MEYGKRKFPVDGIPIEKIVMVSGTGVSLAVFDPAYILLMLPMQVFSDAFDTFKPYDGNLFEQF